MGAVRKLVLGSIAVSAGLLGALAMARGNPAGADTNQQFAMMDTNKDGRISAAEHAAGARSMFEKMDSNKDGKVTAAEMTAAHKAVTGRAAKKSEMSAADKIKSVDSNGDGILSAEEHATGSMLTFAQMDADSDGYLSKEELAAGHASLLKKPAK
jgi:Ca2+-binding EF-hand superfamily protein